VIDQDYSEGYHDDIPVRKRGSSKFIIGFGLLALSVVGVTFAANISIGSGNRLEFGQGLYQITACDQWIGIKLNPTAASYDGQSRVANVNISGLDVLDTGKCRGVDFRIQLRDSSDAVMPLFEDRTGSSPHILVDRLLFNISSDVNTDRRNALSFYSGYGVKVSSTASGTGGFAYDNSQYLSYNGSTGIYTIIFNYPQATMSAVYSLTVQSARP
jgi:hypothetical protein